MHSKGDSRHALKARVFLLIFLIFLSGCGIHFYNKADDDLAKKAQTAFTDSKLSESLVAERVRLKELLDKELQAVRRETSSRRNLYLLNIIGYREKNSWEYFQGQVDSRLRELLGVVANADKQAAELTELLPMLQQEEVSMASALADYLRHKEKSDPLLKCPMKEDNAVINNQFAKIDYEIFKESCHKYTDLYSKLPSEGLIGKIRLELEESNAKNSIFGDSVEKATKKYKQTLQALKDAQSAGANSKIEEATRKLKDLLDEIEKPLSESNLQIVDNILSKMHLEDLKLTGLATKIKLQKDNIDEILEAIVKDNGDSTVDPSAETKLYIRLAAFLPEFKKIIGSSLSYPQVHYLLLESETLRLQLEAAKRRLENAEGRLSLMKLKLKALLTEFKYLYDSKKWLGVMDVKGKDGKSKCQKQKLFTEDFYRFKSGSECRFLMARSLLDYANSWTLGRQPQEEIDYMMIGLRHDAALDSSEIALSQWQNLIGVPLAELVDYHGKGITSADLANLINALGLGSIAVGVIK